MNSLYLRQQFIRRNHNLIVSLYPNTKNIYGPYLGKDGRYRIVLYDGKHRQTRQYCKIKMEVKLERRIHDPDTIDHNNGNKRDDRYSNLVVRNRSEHAKLDVVRRKQQKVKCVWCDTSFYSKISGQKTSTAGPFCSFSCRGKYGASVQNGGSILKRRKYKIEYYKLKEG